MELIKTKARLVFSSLCIPENKMILLEQQCSIIYSVQDIFYVQAYSMCLLSGVHFSSRLNKAGLFAVFIRQ